MSYQVKKLNENTIQQDDDSPLGKQRNKNHRSKNFFKLDRGFGDNNSQNGEGGALNQRVAIDRN